MWTNVAKPVDKLPEIQQKYQDKTTENHIFLPEFEGPP